MISCVTSDGWAGLSQTYVFERLKEPDFFRRICVTEGFVSWPDEIDLAPGAMYAAIKRDGEWILSGECIFIRLTDVQQTTGRGSSTVSFGYGTLHGSLPSQLRTGGRYFSTVASLNRHARWLSEYLGVLRHAFRETRAAQAFHVDAIVVLPEHLHTIWTSPPGEPDFEEGHGWNAEY